MLEALLVENCRFMSVSLLGKIRAGTGRTIAWGAGPRHVGQPG